ncbi:DUF3617 family protein [Usitatibacter palustris]|uniref:DUF3617 family protein n=1 Tax=Usitatibacter palustris TaxID=2732487 RepID=A0A6M4H888_9PROT|nr:DUF3617 family protein [Usitatibacter palustris]QJR15058.1 hypothetical protein DSM104440_01874 [Usitatibacter palustris]
MSRLSRIALAAFLVSGTSVFAQTTTLEPGNWAIGAATITNGQSEPNKFYEVCLTAEHLADVARFFGPKTKRGQSNCVTGLQPVSGNPADKRMRCVAVNYEMEYESSVQTPDSKSFTMRQTMDTESNAGRATVVTALRGKHTGPCKS